MTEQPESIWVKTGAAADGTYIASIEINDDLSVPLTRDTAVRHAMAMLTASQYAQYDTAVINQLTGMLGLPLEGAVEVVGQLREDRPPLDPDDTAPLRLSPGVSMATREAFIGLWLGDQQVGQFDPASATQHAGYVLQVTIAADLDGAYHRWLRSIDLDDDKARAVVAGVRDWRTPETNTETAK